ncbi:MAG: hypothetical protein ACP5RI_02070 [Candidatus Micrarchaeia archaeon]
MPEVALNRTDNKIDISTVKREETNEYSKNDAETNINMLDNKIEVDDKFKEIINEIEDYYNKITKFESNITIPDDTLYAKKHIDQNAKKIKQRIDNKYNKYKNDLKIIQNFAEFLNEGLKEYINNINEEITKMENANKNWKSIDKKSNLYSSTIEYEQNIIYKLYIDQIVNIKNILKSEYKIIENEYKDIKKEIEILKNGTLAEKISIYTGIKKIDDILEGNKSAVVKKHKHQNNNININEIKLILNEQTNSIEHYYNMIKSTPYYELATFKNNNRKSSFMESKIMRFKNEYNNILKVKKQFAEFLYRGLENYKKKSLEHIREVSTIDDKNIVSNIHFIIKNYKIQSTRIVELLEIEHKDIMKREDKIKYLEKANSIKGVKGIYFLLLAYLL